MNDERNIKIIPLASNTYSSEFFIGWNISETPFFDTVWGGIIVFVLKSSTSSNLTLEINIQLRNKTKNS